jgi:hypothetical protein
MKLCSMFTHIAATATSVTAVNAAVEVYHIVTVLQCKATVQQLLLLLLLVHAVSADASVSRCQLLIAIIEQS